MSRIALTRPRHTRAVWDRPATGTRLLPTPHSRLDHSLRRGIPLALSRVEACPEPRRRGSQERNGWGLLPSPPQHTNHYKRCPKADRLRLRSDQSLSPPVHVTRHGRFPDKKPACPWKGPLPSARPTHPAHPFRLLRRRPRARRHSAPSGHSAPLGLRALLGLPRRRPCRPVRTVGQPPTQNKRTF